MLSSRCCFVGWQAADAILLASAALILIYKPQVVYTYIFHNLVLHKLILQHVHPNSGWCISAHEAELWPQTAGLERWNGRIELCQVNRFAQVTDLSCVKSSILTHSLPRRRTKFPARSTSLSNSPACYFSDPFCNLHVTCGCFCTLNCERTD